MEERHESERLGEDEPGQISPEPGEEGGADSGTVRSVPAPVGPRPRIEGVQAAVAAGLTDPDENESDRTEAGGPRHLASDDTWFGGAVPDDIAQGVELPDWADPPTREVPRILLQHGAEPGPVTPGPVWRESDRDWEQDEEAFAEMVSDSVPVAAHDGSAPLEDEFDGAFDEDQAAESVPEPPDVPLSDETGVLLPLAAQPDAKSAAGSEAQRREKVPGRGRVRFAGKGSTAGRGSHAKRPRGEVRRRMTVTSAGPGLDVFETGAELREPDEDAAFSAPVAEAGESKPRRSSSRDPIIATGTGLLIGSVVLVACLIGPPAVLALTALALLVASAECFQSLQKARYQPATLLGLIAAPAFIVAGYLKGPGAIPLLAAIAVVATLCWYLAGVTTRAPVANIGASLLGICWIAVLGSFAGLLLDPSAFPARHGVAYLLGAVEATVAYDVGGYLFGSLLGRHKLAPAISPNKTWEGLLGGSLAAFVVAIAITSQMHPWNFDRAAALGILVALIAPVGDLAESMIKRDIHVKDMGNLLPAHGGLLDRVDALLFVLPATYYLVRLFHG